MKEIVYNSSQLKNKLYACLPMDSTLSSVVSARGINSFATNWLILV